ncbi:MAG: hypothetical protein IPL03_08720 [Sterolibacteriaceae bacterium]|nr:hypothetical protein [Candidatus Methylophosphatis haderslevensis]
MSGSASPAEEAIGVECAWPVRFVSVAELGVVQQSIGGVPHGPAWRVLVFAVVVCLLTLGGWSLKDSAIDIATMLPGGVPTQAE